MFKFLKNVCFIKINWTDQNCSVVSSTTIIVERKDCEVARKILSRCERDWYEKIECDYSLEEYVPECLRNAQIEFEYVNESATFEM